jgi:PhnB protein
MAVRPFVQDMEADRDEDRGMSTAIKPRLIVPSVDEAVAFYASALGAVETFRFTEPSGSVAHCEITIGTSSLSLAQANDDYRLYAPETLAGSPVLLTAIVENARVVGGAMTAAGAVVVVPIEDREYRRCEGRVRDPFGHLWVISQQL